jgi:hypothetical protein
MLQARTPDTSTVFFAFRLLDQFWGGKAANAHA